MKLILLITYLTIACTSILKAQQKIEGTVQDSLTHRPIGGATLQAEGKTVGMTDKNGHFAWNNDGRTTSLHITIVGYYSKTIHLVPQQQHYNILLTPSSHEIEEVTLSTGYQQISRERATGSFEHIDQELLTRNASSNILERLANNTPVLFHNENHNINFVENTPDVTIRGRSSIYNASPPLIILDNFPFEGNISQINPNDIESITILKDAAAASIWGAKAGNGVIVITSKKAKSGQMRFELTSNLTVSPKPALLKDYSISSGEFIELEKFLFGEGYYNATLSNVRKTPVSPVVELLDQVSKNILTEDAAHAEMEKWKSYDVRRDYLSHVYRNSFNQQHHAAVRGGSDRNKYSISAGFDKNLQSLRANSFDRINLIAANNLQLTEKLQIGLKINHMQSNVHTYSPDNRIGYGMQRLGTRNLYPYARLQDEMGNNLPLANNIRLSHIDNAEAQGLLNWLYIPLDELDNSSEVENRRDLLTNIDLQYSPWHNLQLTASYQYSHGVDRLESLQDVSSYYVRNMINLFSTDSGGHLTHNIPIGDIMDRANSFSKKHFARIQSNWQHTFFDHYKLNLLTGAEVNTADTDRDQWRWYGYDDRMRSFANIDYTARYNKYQNLEVAGTIPNRNNSVGTASRFISLYANTSLEIKDDIILSASLRRDASNLFGVATNQKWSPFWSVGGLWNIKNNVLQSTDWLRSLRLKTTYGYNGNIDASRSALPIISYESYRDALTDRIFAHITAPPNPTLTWERVNTFNMGLDLALHNGLSAELNYYIKSTADLFSSIQLDASTGFSSMFSNNASTRTKGLEARLEFRKTLAHLQLRSRLQLNYNRTKITKVYRPDYASANNYLTLAIKEGQLLNEVLSYRWIGLDPENGDPIGWLEGAESKDYNAIVNNSKFEDLIIHGSSRPQIYGSYIQSVGYKNVNLSVSISGFFDYFIRRPSVDYTSLINQGTMHHDYERRWKETGDEQHTQVPSFVYPLNTFRDRFYYYSEQLVEPGDHLRLQDVNLSYTLQPSWGRRQAGPITVYINTSNLGLLWTKNKKGIDPKFYNSGIPETPVYTFGFSASF